MREEGVSDALRMTDQRNSVMLFFLVAFAAVSRKIFLSGLRGKLSEARLLSCCPGLIASVRKQQS